MPRIPDDLSEGSTNLYFTNARADARVTAGITGKLDASAVSAYSTLVDDADAATARATLGLRHCCCCYTLVTSLLLHKVQQMMLHH